MTFIGAKAHCAGSTRTGGRRNAASRRSPASRPSSSFRRTANAATVLERSSLGELLAQRAVEHAALPFVELAVKRLGGVGHALKVRRLQVHVLGGAAHALHRRQRLRALVVGALVTAAALLIPARDDAVGAVLGNVLQRRFERAPGPFLLGRKVQTGLQPRDASVINCGELIDGGAFFACRTHIFAGGGGLIVGDWRLRKRGGRKRRARQQRRSQYQRFSHGVSPA